MSQKTKLIMLAILFVGFFAFLAYNLNKAKKPQRRRQTDAASQAVETASEEAEESQLPATETVEELHGWLAPNRSQMAVTVGRFGLRKVDSGNSGKDDPPQSPPPPPPPPPEMGPLPMLSGTLGVGDGPRQAILNRQPYSKGQKVEGTNYTVGAIGVNTVQVIDDEGKTYTLDLLQ